jgi:hypothetical protein
VLDALSGVAVLWASQNQSQPAAALASLVASHTSSEREAIDRVEPLMAELQSRLPEDEWNAALETGRAMSYESAARKVLEHGFRV